MYYRVALVSLLTAVVIPLIWSAEDDNIIVTETFHGKLRGKQLTTAAGTLYDLYLGVSYANPPQKVNRFKLPYPNKHWHEFKDAFNVTKRCVQNPFTRLTKLQNSDWIELEEESEDCLYVNIVSPRRRPSSEPYPILYVIHDGWFNYGGISDFNVEAIADAFVSKDIMVVFVQYRLGLLGFLSTGDKQGMGNWGLWDIIQGLKYLKETIHKFGGDPKKITVFGYGSGGVLASLLNYIPEAETYFNQSISHSGAAHSFWGISDDRPVLVSEGISDDIECGEFDSKINKEKAMECLRAKTIPQMVKAAKNVVKILDNYEERVPELLYLAPRFDEIMIHGTLKKLSRSTLVKPMLIGVSQGEMGPYVAAIDNPPKYDQGFERLSVKDPTKFTKDKFDAKLKTIFPSELWSSEEEELKREVEKVYFPDHNVEAANSTFYVLKFGQLMDDIWVNVGAFQDALVNAEKGSPVYLYNLDFSKSRQSSKDMRRSVELLKLLNFDRRTAHPALEKFESAAASDLISLWVNFIKTGDPLDKPVDKITEWPQFTAEHPAVLQLSADSSTWSVQTDFYPERVAYWTSKLPEKPEPPEPETPIPQPIAIDTDEETETIEVVEDIKEEL